MNQVFGKLNLVVSVPVNCESEPMALMEANYKYNNGRAIVYKVFMIDHDGNEKEITVHEGNIELDEFVAV